MSAYYNEVDPFMAAWLRELICAKLIAEGEVDERRVENVKPEDIRGFSQHHFFAGIGVWSYALRKAGWQDDDPVWTGSCPCQPFSSAGKRLGTADARHLWPAWFRLIRECRPRVVFGEQVASKDGLAWLDIVSADLEAAGYAIGSADICAAGFGAPHIRQRLYFVADSERDGRRTDQSRREAEGRAADGRSGEAHELGDAERQGLEGHARDGGEGKEPGRVGANETRPVAETSFTNGFWRDAEWIPCRDGKYRPVEPGTFPLAAGVADRVGRLRGYGNALCAEAAAGFVKAYLEETVK